MARFDFKMATMETSGHSGLLGGIVADTYRILSEYIDRLYPADNPKDQINADVYRDIPEDYKKQLSTFFQSNKVDYLV